MALPSHIINPTYAPLLFVYLDLAGNLSHTLNIFIFFCNFPGTCPNLTRERSIPLFRLRLPALQISCLLLWLQRDANIQVQALRSIQHTLYSSVFHSCCPSGTHSFSLHFLSSVSTHSPYRFCLAVSQKLSNASLCVVCSSFPTLSFISVPGFPLLLFLVYLLPGHRLWSSQTTLNLSTITGDLLTVWCLVLSYLITANQESSVFSSIYPLHALSFTFRHFYPKSLSLHSMCTFKFFQFLLSLGIEPMTLRC